MSQTNRVKQATSFEKAFHHASEAEKNSVGSTNEDLLKWSLSNLSTITQAVFGLSPENLERWVDIAKSRALQTVADVHNEYSQMLRRKQSGTAGYLMNVKRREIELSPQTEAIFEEARRTQSALEESIQKLNPTAETTRGVVKKFSVMKEVFERADRFVGYNFAPRSEGFVDVAAKVFIPSGLKLEVVGVGEPSAQFPHGYFSEYREDDKLVQQTGQALAKGDIRFSAKGSTSTVWFIVRSEPIELIDTLQTLRRLSRLEKRTQKIVLVVNFIEEDTRVLIEDAGFHVFVRASLDKPVIH